jgi:CubicO group peptidase (beta-lactamase class C family)
MPIRPLPPITLAIVALAAAAGPRMAAAQPAPAAPPDSARLERALRGLRPLIEVEGRPPVRWTLEERMALYRVPAVSIAIVEGGRVALTRAVGVKEAGKPDPVTPTTLFQAASISKPVTATGMLRLVERGTLQLDTDVNRYLTSWKVPDNAFTATEKVTLRRIVSHRAGLTVHGFPGYARTEPVPTVVQVLDGEKPANTAPVRVDTTPGAITRYSGGGTTVMQQLLVDVTGTPFPALMQQLVLGPAGMTHSTFEQPLPSARAAEAAQAHDRRGTVIAGGWHAYPEMAPAGLWTTPTDLATWAVAVAEARTGRSTGLLSQAMAAQMLTPQQGGSYGLGPSVDGTGRAFRFGHGGANAGFHSDLTMYPELGVGAAIMTNSDGGPLLIRELRRALAAEYGWADGGPRRITVVALDSAAAAGVAGRYTLRTGAGVPVEIRQQGTRLTMHAPELPVEELLPESDTRFVLGTTIGWRLDFTRNAGGRATGFSITRDRDVIEAAREP